MCPNTGVAYLDRVCSGISEFSFILRQLNGGGLDGAFHCSAHEVQRVQEYRFDGPLMQRDLSSAMSLAFSAFSGEPQYPCMIMLLTSKGYLAVGAVTSGARPVRSIPPFGPGL